MINLYKKVEDEILSTFCETDQLPAMLIDGWTRDESGVPVFKSDKGESDTGSEEE